MLSALNKRLFAIRRLKNHLNPKSLMKVIDGLFPSKLRYGIQLFGKVRRNETDPTNLDIENIQKVQNNLQCLLIPHSGELYLYAHYQFKAVMKGPWSTGTTCVIK